MAEGRNSPKNGGVVFTRAHPLRREDREVLEEALRRSPDPLALGAVVWALGAKEAHSASLDEALKWAKEGVSKLGKSLTESQLEAMLAPFVESGTRVLECAGHLIDTLAERLYPKARGRQGAPRKRSGVYLTPYPVAVLMVERGLRELESAGTPPLPLLDPGTGTGVFLSAALRALAERGIPPRESLKGFFGVEKDWRLAQLAKLLLALEGGLEPEEALLGEGATVIAQDFLLGDLAVEARGPYRFVVMNPPYERLAKVDGADEAVKSQAKEYAKRIRESALYPLSGRGGVDTYRLFMERSLSLLAPLGAASFIVPATFLADREASELRCRFIEEGWIASVDFYPERARVFPGVSQEVVILTLSRREKAGIDTLFEGHPLGTLPFKEVRALSARSPLPLVNQRGLVLYQTLARCPRLGDLPGIEVRRGELDQNQDRSVMGRGGGRLLRGEHVNRFRTLEGDRCDLEAFLAKKRGSAKREHVFLPRVAGRQVANRSAKERLIFAHIEPPTVLGNSLNYLVFTRPPQPPFDLLVLLGLLNSSLLNWFFHVNNSNNHVGLYELEALPIPGMGTPDLLRRIGALSAKAMSQEWDASSQSELDALALEAFGLHPEDLEGVFPPVQTR